MLLVSLHPAWGLDCKLWGWFHWPWSFRCWRSSVFWNQTWIATFVTIDTKICIECSQLSHWNNLISSLSSDLQQHVQICLKDVQIAWKPVCWCCLLGRIHPWYIQIFTLRLDCYFFALSTYLTTPANFADTVHLCLICHNALCYSRKNYFWFEAFFGQIC